MRKGVLLGPPGAGKGTQASWLSDYLSVPLIATGDTFRLAVKEGTELGKKAESYMNSGALVPDQLVIDLRIVGNLLSYIPHPVVFRGHMSISTCLPMKMKPLADGLLQQAAGILHRYLFVLGHLNDVNHVAAC